MMQSTVPSGHMCASTPTRRGRLPGVLAILTHDNAPALPQKGRAAVKPPAGRMLSLLQDDVVHYNGEPIGVVVAESSSRLRSRPPRRCAVTLLRARRRSLDFAKAKGSAYTSPETGTRSQPDKRGATSMPASAAAVRD